MLNCPSLSPMFVVLTNKTLPLFCSSVLSISGALDYCSLFHLSLLCYAFYISISSLCLLLPLRSRIDVRQCNYSFAFFCAYNHFSRFTFMSWSLIVFALPRVG